MYTPNNAPKQAHMDVFRGDGERTSNVFPVDAIVQEANFGDLVLFKTTATTNNSNYLYLFGDDLVDQQIRGTTFGNSCHKVGGGLQAIRSWYENARLRREELVKRKNPAEWMYRFAFTFMRPAAVDYTYTVGFVHAINYRVSDPGIQRVDFVVHLKTLPTFYDSKYIADDDGNTLSMGLRQKKIQLNDI